MRSRSPRRSLSRSSARASPSPRRANPYIRRRQRRGYLYEVLLEYGYDIDTGGYTFKEPTSPDAVAFRCVGTVHDLSYNQRGEIDLLEIRTPAGTERLRLDNDARPYRYTYDHASGADIFRPRKMFVLTERQARESRTPAVVGYEKRYQENDYHWLVNVLLPRFTLEKWGNLRF